MQAIKTKYLPATNTKPSRIKAECEAGSITISYDHSLNIDELHQKAAKELLNKLSWNPDFINSGSFKGDYYHILEFTTLHSNKQIPDFLKLQA